MNAAELVDALGKSGVELMPAGDQLRYRGPANVLTPEVLASLRENKAEVMAFFADGAPWVPCTSCGGRIFWADAREPPDQTRWHCDNCDPSPPTFRIHACVLPPPAPTC
jgi:hypothetical protein